MERLAGCGYCSLPNSLHVWFSVPCISYVKLYAGFVPSCEMAPLSRSSAWWRHCNSGRVLSSLSSVVDLLHLSLIFQSHLPHDIGRSRILLLSPTAWLPGPTSCFRLALHGSVWCASSRLPACASASGYRCRPYNPFNFYISTFPSQFQRLPSRCCSLTY